MQNLHLSFVLCSASQKDGEDFAKFCGLLRIYELYQTIDSQKVNLTLIVSPTFIFLNDEWLNDDEVILRLNSFSFCIMHTLLGKPIYLSKGQHCTPDLLHTAFTYT